MCRLRWSPNQRRCPKARNDARRWPGRRQSRPARPKHVARPIALFLGAKLVAYTLLGALLGWLGSVLQLTPTVRGILQIAIGIYMVGNALRMFEVHPIFRYFVFEPPRRA